MKFGLGWELFKDFSIGLAGQYYWGDITRSFTVDVYSIENNHPTSSLVGVDKLSVSKVKAQFGVQYSILNNEKHRLNVGATYDIGGDIKAKEIRTVVGGSSYRASMLRTTPSRARLSSPANSR